MPAKVSDQVRERARKMMAQGEPLGHISDTLGVSVSFLTKLKAGEDAGAAPVKRGRKPGKGKKGAVPVESADAFVDRITSPGALESLRDHLAQLFTERAALQDRIERSQAVLRALVPPTTVPDSRQTSIPGTHGIVYGGYADGATGELAVAPSKDEPF